MSKKSRSKNLTIVFVILLAAILIFNYFESRKGERTFRKEVVSIDTAKITSIKIYSEIKALKPAKGHVNIVRTDNSWRIKNDSIDAQVDNRKIKAILTYLVSMKPDRVSSIEKSDWKKFQVTDSLAVRVKVFNNKKCLTDFYIGKYLYKKPKVKRFDNSGSLYTYVRLADEDIVYCVQGFLKMSFTTDIRMLRDKNLLKLKKHSINKLNFSFPDNSSYSVIKQNNKWLIGDKETDSLTTDKYINSLINLTNSNFIKDENKIKLSNPDYILKVEGDNFKPQIIKAFKTDDGKIILTSSRNKGSKFDGDKLDLFKRIFVEKQSFFEKSKDSKKSKNMRKKKK